jgi:hypothetical protein
MQDFSIDPDSAVSLVEALRIHEALVEIALACFKSGVLAIIQLGLDVIEGYGDLDKVVVDWELPLGRQPHKIGGDLATSS